MRIIIASMLAAACCCAGCKRSGKSKGTGQNEHVMVGKLLIQPHIGKNSGGKSDPDHESLLESQLKTLRSPDMRKLAEAAILNDHPDWKPSEIKLDVERIRRSSVVSITGRGSDPDCARVLIDGVMNLYVASVSPVRPVVDPKNTGGDLSLIHISEPTRPY